MGYMHKILILLSIISLAAGCATNPQGDQENVAARKISGASQATWLYARVAYESPVNRPVSNAMALGSFALKSAGGFMRRAAISAVHLPALDAAIPPVADARLMDRGTFEETLDRVTGTRRNSGRISFLVDGAEYFGRLVEAIDAAEDSIDIRTYIFDNDDFAVAMADQLRQKSHDLRVRIMVDSIGNMLALQTDPDSLPAAHQHPISMHRYLEAGSGIQVRSVANPWLITGDHTKTTIIDGKTAFVGGMNIGREYRYDWHDLMMEISGPVVDQLQYESDKAWARSSLFGDLAHALRFLRGKKKQAAREGYPVRILQTKNFDSQIYRAQIAAIQNARSRIFIENAYFGDDRMIYELARARRRGVDVRVIIPARGNHGPLDASNKVTINRLLKHGIRVYEYPGMSHIKAAIYDGWICVGSANFDKLSLKVNKELNLATSDPATVNALLGKVFLPDLLASREITEPVPVTVSAILAEFAVDELL